MREGKGGKERKKINEINSKRTLYTVQCTHIKIIKTKPY